ncbi:YggT family protein [Tissierella creatinini]|nr:YggT family protein [Tissierella creatinini]TJX69218.1 YggT family protein [Soehngenia saccharolytica]
MSVLLRSIKMLFELLELLIIIRVFMSIFRVSFQNPVGKIIYELTEPIIAPAKVLLHKLGLDRSMIDFSPWVAVILLRVIYSIFLRIF